MSSINLNYINKQINLSPEKQEQDTSKTDISANINYRKKYDTLVASIGNTPIVRLNHITKNSPHSFWVKLEYMNPGGSVKDRLGLALIQGAEQRQQLIPGTKGIIVEATSGNTGLGLAMIAAIKGYQCIFVMPDKISEEKQSILKAYGAKVIITPTAVAPEDPRSYLSVAKKIVDETPGAFYSNQYHNPDNVEIHYQTTGPEIWNQMDGKINAFVAGAGTGGTISGVGKYLKEKDPQVQVVLADPDGSILYDLFHHGKIVSEPHSYKVEGVGEDMLPENVHLKVLDDAIRVTDLEAFTMTRRLVQEEGLCVGPSSGLALVAAIEYSKKLTTPSNLLILFADHGRAYLSKTFNNDWLIENGLLK